ncbi:MAG: hypothetical protein P8I82_01535, partial [Flavobacteriales bacterium]|nr:hypothetical protein [Flavobacteriales bacterium]
FGQEGHLLADNGSDVWSVTLELDPNAQYLYKFRNQPSFGGWDGFEDASGLIAGGCNTGGYNDRYVDVAEADIVLDVVAYGSCTAEVPGVSGCMDAAATNYNADATVQAEDQYGNLLCVYATCDVVPENGCLYNDSFGVYNEEFGHDACSGYGGTPCGENEVVEPLADCMDANATNYNADATEAGQDQHGNSVCIYASCDVIPEPGCIYGDGFGSFNAEFGADACTGYGGTPCEGAGSSDAGCMDANASNYDAAATVQAYDENNNSNCLYDSCDDIPNYGCIYTDGFGLFHDQFNGSACTEYGGTPCEAPEVLGCMDESASNYDETANTHDASSCTYAACSDVPEGGCIYSDGTFEAWADDFTAESGFCATYDGTSCIVGCIDANATNYDAAAAIQATDENGNLLCTFASCDDTPNLGCLYEDSFGAYAEGFGPDNCIGYGGTSCETSSAGCMDANASNYDAAATEQALDGDGNILCSFASCEDAPSDGCNYTDLGSFGTYNENFGNELCTQFGGTPCGLSEVVIPGGCIDENASNYDAAATEQAVDQWNNQLCTYLSCADVPSTGCMYTAAFATYHASFSADDCLVYGGTPCSDASEGCMDENADNYDADATVEAHDQYGNLICTFATCDDIPDAEGCIYDVTYAALRSDFTAENCETYGGTACVEAGEGPTSQSIVLPSGWSMFSSYMVDGNMDLATVLAPIVENVIIAKNNEGKAYLVEWNFNGVGEMIVGQGYQIKTDAEVTLTIGGAYASPESNPVAIVPGWNMIGYLATEARDAKDVLADINASGNLIIAKDYNGKAYLPEWDFNGIGNMVPGQGYQLKTNNSDVLSYASGAARSASKSVMLEEVKHFEKPSITDNNMTVVIEDAAWDAIPAEGSEVAAYDNAGKLIGSAVYSSPVTVLSVWGDDATTTSKDGLSAAEVAKFKVWNAEDVKDFDVNNWSKGSAAYTTNAINVASSITTINAIAELNSSSKELVKVVNILGQEVSSDDVSFVGTVFFNIYDDGSVEKIVK